VRKLVSGTGIAAGLLLAILPRWVLPPCGHEGLPGLHCADTARAEIVVGALLVAAGALAIGAARSWLLAADAAGCGALLAFAWLLPDVTGYCPSPRMPCHYGMVPGVRLVAMIAAAVLLVGWVALARARRKGREP
jgi:hypothetical protein